MKTIGFETLTVSDTSGGVTVATIDDTTFGSANVAVFGPLETAQIRWRDDGTDPTASVGHLMEVGDVLIYDGKLLEIEFIRTGATSGSLPATYYREVRHAHA